MKTLYALMLIGVLFSCKKNDCCEPPADYNARFFLQVRDEVGNDLLDTTNLTTIYNDEIRLYQIGGADTVLVTNRVVENSPNGYSLTSYNGEKYELGFIIPVNIDKSEAYYLLKWSDSDVDKIQVKYTVYTKEIGVDEIFYNANLMTDISNGGNYKFEVIK